MVTTKARIEELKARMAGAGIEFLRIENVNIKRPLTEAQMAEIAQEITEHVLESKRLEDEKKEEAKRLKGLQDKEDAQSQALSTIYQDGHTNIDENCLIGFDKNRNVISIVDPVTGREVATRMVKDSDMQTSMPITPDQEAPEAPRAPEALALTFDKGKSDEGPLEVAGVVLDVEDMTGELEDAQVGQPETATVVTQIASVAEESGAMFAETPDGTFYSTDSKVQEILKAAANAPAESRGYIELTYFKSDTRNQEIASAAIRPPVEEVPFDGTIPDGVIDASDDLD